MVNNDLGLIIAIEKIKQTEHERLIKHALETGNVPSYALDFPPFRWELKEVLDRTSFGKYTEILLKKITDHEE